MRSVLPSIVVLFVSLPCLATTIHVPSEQPTIQAGINASQSGDTVLVECGTYYEHDIILRAGITVMSATGHYSCATIDVQDLGQGFIAQGLNAEVTIKGFAIEDGHGGEGGGIQCLHSSLLVEACYFHSCGATRGGGILAENGANVHVRDCYFRQNIGVAAGGAIYGISNSSIIVEDSVFEWNNSTGGAGITAFYDTALTVERSEFYYNTCPDGVFSFGCGIVTVECYNHATIVEDCIFRGNHAVKGGGIAVGYSYDTRISGCTFYENSGSSASGIWLEYTDAQIDHSIIAFGDGPSNGGFGSMPELSCCDVFGNIGGDWLFLFHGQDEINNNLTVDPLFCLEDNPDDPLTLSCQSLCAAENNPDCGQIGARGVGCGLTVTQETSWSALKLLY